MKKIILLGLMSMLALSCWPWRETLVVSEPPPGPPCGKEWIWTPPTAEDAYYGVGNAKISNLNLAKRTATQRARFEVAESCSLEVSTLVKDFMEQSGITGESLQFSQAVGKTVSNVVLKGSIIIDTCLPTTSGGPSSEYWVLVEYPIGKLREMTMDAARQEAMKEEAAYNEWKATKGFEALEQELGKMKAND